MTDILVFLTVFSVWRYAVLVAIFGSLYTKSWPGFHDFFLLHDNEDVVSSLIGVAFQLWLAAPATWLVTHSMPMAYFAILGLPVIGGLVLWNCSRIGVNPFGPPPPIEYERQDRITKAADDKE